MIAPADRLVIALAQIAAIVGDIEGNLERLRKARAEAAAMGADLMLAPELYLAGYPPEDLVLKPAFQEACRAACETLARETADDPGADRVDTLGLRHVDPLDRPRQGCQPLRQVVQAGERQGAGEPDCPPAGIPFLDEIGGRSHLVTSAG